MEFKSFAKINLYLNVISKREDGYHNIESIMQKVSLYDEITLEKMKYGFKLESNIESLENKDNLIYKLWKKLCESLNRELPVKVYLKKNIPLAAGLAGGTSNGATFLYAINDLYKLNLTKEDLISLATPLGADFPYMLTGGTAICKGIGEIIRPIEDFNSKLILIVNPAYEISTKEVYGNLDISEEDHKNIEDLIIDNKIKNIDNLLYNKMEDYVFKTHNDLKLIKEKLIDFNSNAIMSGSGPSIFGIFKSEEDLNKAYLYFKEKYKNTFKVQTIGGEDEYSNYR